MVGRIEIFFALKRVRLNIFKASSSMTCCSPIPKEEKWFFCGLAEV